MLAGYQGYSNLAGLWGKIGISTRHNAVHNEMASLLQ